MFSLSYLLISVALKHVTFVFWSVMSLHFHSVSNGLRPPHRPYIKINFDCFKKYKTKQGQTKWTQEGPEWYYTFFSVYRRVVITSSEPVFVFMFLMPVYLVSFLSYTLSV